MKYEPYQIGEYSGVINTATGCIYQSHSIAQESGRAVSVSESSVFIPGEHWNPETQEFEVIRLQLASDYVHDGIQVGDDLPMKGENFCPFTDHNGVIITEGDTLRHPDGKTGIATLCKRSDTGRTGSEYDWFVKYDDNDYGLLQLQVGDKGMATVVNG